MSKQHDAAKNAPKLTALSHATLCLLAAPSAASFFFNQGMNDQNTSIEYVLFDWDGTLLTSFEADATAYLLMFQASLAIGSTIWGPSATIRRTGIACIRPRVCPARSGTSRPLVAALLSTAET
jgi:hypothetical protein